MDIEDWYHLDYLKDIQINNDLNFSMLDGLNNYSNILKKNNIRSSFFVLGELATSLKNVLRKLCENKHDIGSHGWDHKRPLTLSAVDFEKDIIKSKKEIEDIIGKEVFGYRAPCFSLDDKKLDLVKKNGYKFDSSKIDFGNHPLYGNLDMGSYKKLSNNIYKKDDFFEFQVSTHPIFGKNIPVSGGGYVRIFPWLIMKKMISKYLGNNEIYVFYIHPFEFSKKESPNFKNISFANKSRFNLGRSSVELKFNKLINLLKQNNFEFTTFSELRNQLI